MPDPKWKIIDGVRQTQDGRRPGEPRAAQMTRQQMEEAAVAGTAPTQSVKYWDPETRKWVVLEY